ncbi:MFS transporter [Nannocystis bainbridge]|uniref:MFS transporter n=1 Tax=Nannocystis bainbridge TaxID=2995303 RepID=A0ABT5DT14_9BACT|nr:MFS transporter [Nannocystis bainbridge]MDC0716315.1 MFS transporter [Nannocystis bainbridge]
MVQHLQVDPSASHVGVDVDVSRLRWRGVMRHVGFRRVWLGAMASSIGTWMEGVGVQWLMAEQTSSTLMLGALAAAQLGPMLILGLPAGLLVDWVDRRQMLLITQVVMMAIAALLAVAHAFGWATPPVLIGLGLVNGIAMAFNTPAWQTLSPRLVPREELPRAIALMGMQFNLARVAGPALAGLLMAKWGATLLFTINALSFVGVLWAVRSTAPAPPASTGAHAPWREVSEALRFVRDHVGARRVMLGLLLLSMLAAPLQRMLPLFVSEVYHAEEATYGLMLSAVGAGAVLGGLSLGRLPSWYPRHHIIPLALLMSGASMTIYCALTEPAWAAACLLVSGFFWIWAFSSLMTSVQLLTPDAMRGRVLALFNMAMFGAMPVGSVLSALLGDRLAALLGGGPGLAVQLGVGVFTLVLWLAGAVLLIWRTPEIDDLKPGDHGHARRPGLWAGITAAGHRPA